MQHAKLPNIQRLAKIAKQGNQDLKMEGERRRVKWINP
jgi:hypothetical protein